MNKRRIPRLITILLMTVITIVFWIGIDVYRALTVKPAPEVPANILLPLNPNLDEQVLSGLEKRVYTPDDQITSLPISKNREVENITTPIPVATAEPTPTVESTSSPEPTTQP